MKTIEIIKGITGTKEYDSPYQVMVYDSGELRKDIIIDLQSQLDTKGGFDIYTEVINSGSTKYVAPNGYDLVCVGAKTRELNERGNPVCRTISIIAAYKL